MPKNEIRLTQPEWLDEMCGKEIVLPSTGDRMRFVIDLSRRNVEERSGGPFAAAVFSLTSGRCIAAGVNRVEPLACSLAHAEIMAIGFAQKKIGCYDLGTAGPCQLVSSSQPCAMCFGALLWSGIRCLVFAANRSDVEKIVGFDEGPLPWRWKHELERRGIEVSRPRLRTNAVSVLRLYKELGLTLYSPGR